MEVILHNVGPSRLLLIWFSNNAVSLVIDTVHFNFILISPMLQYNSNLFSYICKLTYAIKHTVLGMIILSMCSYVAWFSSGLFSNGSNFCSPWCVGVCAFLTAGMDGDPDLNFLLNGADLMKVRSGSWKKVRFYKLQEDCKTVWHESKKTLRPKHTCESIQYTCTQHNAPCWSNAYSVYTSQTGTMKPLGENATV